MKIASQGIYPVGAAQDRVPGRRFGLDDAGLALDDRQRALVRVAEDLGRNCLAPRAQRHDTEASFPFRNFDDLRDADLLSLCVPSESGGRGASILDHALVCATLGRFCGATALTFNMHTGVALWIGSVADSLHMSARQRSAHRQRRDVQFRRMIDGALYAQAVSEAATATSPEPVPDSGADADAVRDPLPGTASLPGPVASCATKATRDGDGWIIDGRKIFTSSSGAADFYAVSCAVTESAAGSRGRPMTGSHAGPQAALAGGRAPQRLYVAVPSDAPGLSVIGDWDALGMRGTVSRTLVLDHVRVEDDAVMMHAGLFDQARERWPHMLALQSAPYMGLGSAALEFTVRYLRGEVPGAGAPVRRRSQPSKRASVARMELLHEQMRALFLRSFGEAGVDPSRAQRLRCLAMHHTVMEHANEVCALALRACGGQALTHAMPLERYYRDSRCGSLMLPWTAEYCLERLGCESLYGPGESDD